VARRIAPGADARRWLDLLGGFDPAGATVLKDDGDTAVWRARLDGRDVVVKRWRLRSASSRVKSALRSWRGDRHWRGARRLLEGGIQTGEPWVLAVGPGVQWLVMEWVPGRTVLEHLATRDLGPREELGGAAAVGDLVAATVRAGLFNRDGKPSNLIMVQSPQGAEIAVIDCVGIRRSRDPVSSAMRMLASLYVEPSGCGCPPRRPLILAAIQAMASDLNARDQKSGKTKDAVRTFWNVAGMLVRLHGDPKPRVDPLAATPPPSRPFRA
jgi:tRNA A-37 threonylcarbamoyl transferase component Bud32